jgi:hypothetical protein
VIVYAPQSLDGLLFAKSVFLAGSIEMGAAEDWQDVVASSVKSKEAVILNPRRKDWDSSWVQSIHNPQFRQQVEWELEAMDKARHIFMYFSPGTKSPITLLELGLHADHQERLVVCCPDGFWRKGNVDVVCRRYGIPQVPNLPRGIEELNLRLGE